MQSAESSQALVSLCNPHHRKLLKHAMIPTCSITDQLGPWTLNASLPMEHARDTWPLSCSHTGAVFCWHVDNHICRLF